MPEKKPTQKHRILAALKEGPKTNAYFIDTLRIFRYSSRIRELQQAVHVQAGRLELEPHLGLMQTGQPAGQLQRLIVDP